ncbi:MAG: cupin domain-containing protein [Halobacteriales archaeon]|nr:cupin domain-containing protein [Halobacteriales archaeon]
MEKARIDDQDRSHGPAADKRRLTDAIGATNLSINYYELAPGDSFAFGYHAHSNQEEVFYIQNGTVTFETDDGTVAVAAGEVIRFAPGEHQRGVNQGDERVVAIALGAPQDSGVLDLRRSCDACGDETKQRIEMAEDKEALVTLCERCDAVTGRFVHGEVDDTSST